MANDKVTPEKKNPLHPMIGNKNALGGKGNWHLKKYKTEEELIPVLESYFVEENLPWTVNHLTLHLGFSDKHTTWVYKKDPVLGHLVRRALTIIEGGYERNLHGNNPRGSIFALQSMDWGTNSNQNITVQDLRIDLTDPDDCNTINIDDMNDDLFD